MPNDLNFLLARVEKTDPALADEIRAHIEGLASRREFGLNFEHHKPERVPLIGRSIGVGDKVVFVATRGETGVESNDTWVVEGFDGASAKLRNLDADEEATRSLDDLVFVADFRDPIYPGLHSRGAIGRSETKPFHSVINGENYHVLEALMFTHQGKVDAIYIDPPYNSGARDWKYNNNYVDGNDVYRHSKWLAYIERRLKLARRLLDPRESVMIVAIDENEVHRLGLLLQQLFPGSKIQMVTVQVNRSGASIIDQFSRVEEHLFFVHIGSARPIRTSADTTPGTSKFVTEEGVAKPFQWESLQRSGGNSRRQDTKAKFFAVYVDPTTSAVVGCGDHVPLDADRDSAPPPPPGCISQWPIKQDGTEACWQLSAPTLRKYLADGRIRLGRLNKNTGRYGIWFLTSGHMEAINKGELVVEGRDDQGSLIVNNAEGRTRSLVGKTMWTNVAYSATEFGSRLLRNFLPRRKFPFPKSLYSVEDALRFYVGAKPDAVILDFFAGSGTTLHAVARLNRQDGGSRQSICVTNNEVSLEEHASLIAKALRPGDPEWERLGIFEYITEPRVRAALTGVNSDGEPVPGAYRAPDAFPMAEGFEENAEFFDLTYENPALVELDMAFAAIAPLLWLRAGSVGRRIDQRTETFDIADAYAVLFEIDAAASFLEAVTKADGLRVAYIVTDDEPQFQAIAVQLPPAISPVRLYETYLRTFEINTSEE